ncbi:MAG: hypothetical protein LBD48_05120 [Treponema sp.]|jgi:hypothetical protein|nr:hypothetical protein [Treponema sp.]
MNKKRTAAARPRRIALTFLAAVMGAAYLSGCLSLVEKTGRALDGSAFAEKQTAVYRAANKESAAADMALYEVTNKAGERSIIITIAEFPAMKLRGSAPDSDGVFYLAALDYLGGSTSGWNEFRLDVSGGGKLSLNGSAAVLSVSQGMEAVQISSGKIHRNETRITGSKALTSLRNRRERILALTGWMRQREGAPPDLDRDAFEAYWKPLLFPEMVSKKKRPSGWEREGDQRVKAEDVRWNTGYTARLFDEQLGAVRNSGTLLRDWEEALEWIYLEHEWDRIAALLEGEITLTKTKK